MEDLGLRMNYQNSNNPNFEFWNGKKVLITGHTGFKGSWLALWLLQMNAKVYGISLPPESSKNLFDSLKICHLPSISLSIDLSFSNSFNNILVKINY